MVQWRSSGSKLWSIIVFRGESYGSQTFPCAIDCIWAIASEDFQIGGAMFAFGELPGIRSMIPLKPEPWQ